jgi:hypothetical protein
MNDFKKLTLVAAIIAGLAVIGSLMNSQQSTARAAGGPTVTIDPTQLPLPVQGSLGVSGTVAATQSGAWNVGISGTPHVNVTNPATAPVLFLNVNDPGRIPYQTFVTASGNNVAFPAIPAGHRLVIQNASIQAAIAGSNTSTSALAELTIAGIVSRVGDFVMTAQLYPDVALATVNQPFTAYFDAGQQPVVGVILFGSGTAGSVIATLTGYMLDCTIAPCAAIAP